MSESIFILLFFIFFLILVIFAKKYLYANEHEASIRNELNTFDDNLKEIENIDIDKISDFELGPDHIYK